MIGRLDHVLVSVIIAFQFLGCLFLFGSVILFSRYPGADYSVGPAFLASAAGIAAVVVLQKNQKIEFWRRLPAFFWNVALAAYFMSASGGNSRASNNGSYVVTFNVCAAIYLGLTALIGPSVLAVQDEEDP